MSVHAKKSQENHASANMLGGSSSPAQFMDNRPEAIAQRQTQEAANGSPQVQQLKSYQNMADGSEQVQQLKGKQKEANAQGAEKVAKLHVHADLDAPGMGLVQQLLSGQVGHAWCSLEWNDPTAIPADIPANHSGYLGRGGVQADPMGFWPKMFDSYDAATEEWSGLPDDQRVGYSSNPFKSYVPGQMVHPDNLHKPKATQSFDITKDQAVSAIEYAESKRDAEYSVYFYNCTTFAKEAAQAAGQSPPSMGTLGICYPDALYKSIVKNQKKKKGTTTVNSDTGSTSVVGDAPKKG
jgi:hypothetical protein